MDTNPFEEILVKIVKSPLSVEILTDFMIEMNLEPNESIAMLESLYNDWDK